MYPFLHIACAMLEWVFILSSCERKYIFSAHISFICIFSELHIQIILFVMNFYVFIIIYKVVLFFIFPVSIQGRKSGFSTDPPAATWRDSEEDDPDGEVCDERGSEPRGSSDFGEDARFEFHAFGSAHVPSETVKWSEMHSRCHRLKWYPRCGCCHQLHRYWMV